MGKCYIFNLFCSSFNVFTDMRLNPSCPALSRWAAVLGLASTSTWRLLEAWNPPWVMQSTWLPSGTALTLRKRASQV